MKKIRLIVAAVLVAFLVFPGQALAVTNLDPTFGVGGKTTTSFGQNAYLSDLTLQPDGKILAVGYVHNGSNIDWKIARYNADGALDASFGSGGFVSRDFGGDDSLEGVAVQSDGKIIVSGYGRISPSSFSDWTLARYNSDGTPDLAFGVLGTVKSFPGELGRAFDVLLQPDGKIVAAGGSWKPSTHDEIAVARYNTDGSPDTSFGSGGTVTMGPNIGGTPNDRAYALDLQTDGKIVVFGDYDTGQHRDNVILVRFNANGSPDTSFDGDGTRVENFSFHNGGRDVKLQADGKIVVTGATCNGPCQPFVARYNTTGSLDGSFGTGGRILLSLGNGSGNTLAIQPGGNIVLAGHQQIGSFNDSFVFRLNGNGGPDASFGTNGLFTLALNAGEDYSYGLALQPDGKIIAGGAASDNGTAAVTAWALARITEGPIINEVTLDANADSNVRSGHPDRNYGSGEFMRVQSSGSNRALVRFDQAALQSAIGDGTVLSAKLRLTITDNGNNWGPTGRTVDVHRLLSDWAEGDGTEADRGTGLGATWNCAIDSLIENQAKNCSGLTEWEMGQPNNPPVHPWAETPTDTTTITNGQTGVVEYDVTGDLVAFLNGDFENYGWLIKKTAEGQNGMVSFGTKESPFVAQLAITYEQ